MSHLNILIVSPYHTLHHMCIKLREETAADATTIRHTQTDTAATEWRLFWSFFKVLL